MDFELCVCIVFFCVCVCVGLLYRESICLGVDYYSFVVIT